MTQATIDQATFDELKATAGAEFVAELVGTYGEEAAAKYADSLSKRIRAGEFTVEIVRQ